MAMPAVDEWPETEARIAEVARTRRGRHRDRALAAYRRARAVELRARGLTYEQVAQEVGYTSRATAYNAINQALEVRQVESVEELRRLELDRLDAVHASLWPQAMTGHVPSVLALLRVIDLRTRLLGLQPSAVPRDGRRTRGRPVMGRRRWSSTLTTAGMPGACGMEASRRWVPRSAGSHVRGPSPPPLHRHHHRHRHEARPRAEKHTSREHLDELCTPQDPIVWALLS